MAKNAYAKRLDAARAAREYAIRRYTRQQITMIAIGKTQAVNAVPVSELKKLRDYLYTEDLIFMRGLAELNKLIAKYDAKMDEVSE